MKTILRSLLLGCWILLASGTLGFTHSSTEVPIFTKITEAGSTTFTDGVIERVKATSTTTTPDPADAVLIRAKDWQWSRYFKNALNLPDWLDLELEHRTRCGVYDHPWRSSQPSGRTDPRWRVIIAPAQGWKFQLKQRFWYLATSRGAFAGSGLRDATGGSGNYLGHDVEVRVQWKITNNVEFDAGYDHWFKGRYFDRLPARAGLPSGGRKDTDYFYILTTFRI